MDEAYLQEFENSAVRTLERLATITYVSGHRKSAVRIFPYHESCTYFLRVCSVVKKGNQQQDKNSLRQLQDKQLNSTSMINANASKDYSWPSSCSSKSQKIQFIY